MIAKGIKASQLIAQLQQQINLHGDLEVFAGGGDYPEGVDQVVYVLHGDPYVPSNSFKIW